VGHEEFADLAAARLENAAARIEADARRLGLGKEIILNRAGELRLAAHLVREEARSVSGTEDGSSPAYADNPPLEGQP
jgi:hypothetical protein